jgi:hypothetical protein
MKSVKMLMFAVLLLAPTAAFAKVPIPPTAVPEPSGALVMGVALTAAVAVLAILRKLN